MDDSSSNQWHYADPRQQKPRPSYSQPSFWQQADNLSRVGARPDNRAYQPTVEDAIEDSGMYYGPASSNPYERQPSIPDPYAWARSGGGVQPGASLSGPIRATTNMANRRSFVEPHATFSPPSLVYGSSTLSSASSNFSAATPTFDQQPRRRSSQQAFPDQIDRDALARANKRMASGMSPLTHCTYLQFQTARSNQMTPANQWGSVGRSSFMHSGANFSLASDWSLSDSPFHTEKYDPFAPLQPRAPFVAGSWLYAGQADNYSSFDVRRQSASSTKSLDRRSSHVQPQSQSAPAEDASAFKSHLNSELNRRKVADKTVSSIRSDRARVVAQAKEDARRTDWARDILLKFPMQCALAESLRPEDMMASIIKSGVFDLTASIA